MRAIELTRGFVVVVDDDDYERHAQYRWCFDGRYAVRRKRDTDGVSRKVYLHHEIMGKPPTGMEIDHKNRNKLDCRRENLRLCTVAQNRQNGSLQSSNKSGYRGVHFSKHVRKWVAQITTNGKMRHLGIFKTAEAASRAYNTAAMNLHGEFANLN